MSKISDELRRFADAIDGYTDVKFDRCDGFGCVNYLDGGGIVNGAFTTKWFRNMAGRIDRELVELPKDAHGEYIRVGDTLDGYGKTIEVVEMRYGRGGWVLISRDGNGYADCAAFAHHHAPTVEDVLREFFSRYVTTKPKDEDDAILAEYAAKLRLAGDE